MKPEDLDAALKEAFAAVQHADDVRKYHARRSAKGSPQREADLQTALGRLRKAMIPLRSWRGKSPYMIQSSAMFALNKRVEGASNAIQSERRKLWKMQKRD